MPAAPTTTPLDPWRRWGVGALLLWFGARPVLLLAALAAAVLVDDAMWLGLLGVVAVCAVRPLRRRRAGAAAACGVALLAPATGVLLLGRVLATELALRRIGRGGRAAGLDAVVAARRVPIERFINRPLPPLRESLEAATREREEDEALSRLGEALLDALLRGSARETAACARTLVRGAFGQMPGAPGEVAPFGEYLRREFNAFAVQVVVRIANVGVAVVIGTLVVPGGDWLGAAAHPSRLSALLATLVLVVPLTRAPPDPFSVVRGAAIAFALVQGLPWQLCAIAVAAALAQPPLVFATRRAIAMRAARAERWSPPPQAPRRLRRRWLRAESALARGHDERGIRVLRRLAGSRAARPEVAAAALARVAVIDVQCGRMQQAAETLEQSVRALDSPAAPLPSTLVASGMLAAALGELDEARRRLEQAVESDRRPSALRDRALLALSDVLAQQGEPELAAATIRGLRPLAGRSRAWAVLIESQTAIAASFAAAGAKQAAGLSQRIKELLELIAVDELKLPRGPRALAERQRLAEGRAALLAGRLALRGRLAFARERDWPVDLLRFAMHRLSRQPQRSYYDMAELLYGVALIFDHRQAEGMDHLREALDRRETRRTQLRTGDRRAALIAAEKEVYDLAFRGLLRAQQLGREDAGLLAATLIESLRRNAVGDHLRAAAPTPARARIAEELAALQGSPAALAAPDAERVRAELHTRMAAALAEEYAASYVPEPARAETLLEAARAYDHVISYYAPAPTYAWCAWTARDGRARLEPIWIEGATAARAMRQLAAGDLGALIHMPVREDSGTWSALGHALLPNALRAALICDAAIEPARVLIVPDGAFCFVPWPALELGGRLLAELAVLQMAPDLALLGEQPPRAHGGSRVLVVGDRSAPAEEIARDGAGTMLDVARSGADFVRRLQRRDHAGAYVAAHGAGRGLDQHLALHDGSILSAAVALTAPWPPWVVFASCVVGRVDQEVGLEPLGLIVSCMLQGAHTIVASVTDISEPGAVAVCGRLPAELVAGADCCAALRDAQLRLLEANDLATVADGLGLICMSRLTP